MHPMHQPILTALREMAADGPVRLRVKGDCMQPLLRDGDPIEVSMAERYFPGDIVAFWSDTNKMTVHRMIGYRWTRQGLKLQTRADAAGTLDRPISQTRVIGRVLSGRETIRVTLPDRLRAMARFARLLLGGRLPRPGAPSSASDSRD